MDVTLAEALARIEALEVELAQWKAAAWSAPAWGSKPLTDPTERLRALARRYG